MAVNFSTYLVDSLEYLYTFNLDMGDSLEDVVEWVADEAGLNFNALYYGDDDYDEFEDDEYSENHRWVETKDLEDIFDEALMILTSEHSSHITDTLLTLFTEPDLVDEVLDDMARSVEMRDAIDAVYSLIEEWPNGEQVKDAIANNIFAYLDMHSLKAAEVGSQIGNQYYKYFNSPYLERFCNARVSGERIEDPKYSYEFACSITYASIRALGDIANDIEYVGFACKFYELDSKVLVDFYVCTERYSGDTLYSKLPVYTMEITSFNKSGITQASKQIAQWISDNIETAVNEGLEL